jgi:hypothetical protein
MFCTRCGASVQEEGQYCSICGTKATSHAVFWTEPARPAPYSSPSAPAHTHTPDRRFGQVFGLDPRIAFLTFILDVMLNAGELATAGLLVPVSIAAGIVLGYITYRAQRNWYLDDKESAKIKAIIVGLLTAIPTPLPAIFYVPSGIVGLVHNFRRKLSHT